MKDIKLNSKISVDLEKLIDSRLLVQANSGGGKSWLLRRLLEQSHGKVQQIVIDLEGEFSTLREKYDYILAGKGGDVPADVKSAALLARKLLELNVSAIIDLSEMPQHSRRHFVRLFLDSMIDAPKDLWHPCMVVIDEAHFFVPEKGQSEAASAVIDLATRGRKRGFCAVFATQRLSKLHKDAAAECNNKLVGRTGLDIDMKRAAEELGFTGKDQFMSLRGLEPGEFFAYGPALSKEVTKIKVGAVETAHPKAGARFSTKVVPPTERMKSVLKKLTDLPAEAVKEAETLSSLKEEIKDLKAQLRTGGASKEDIEKAVRAAVVQANQKAGLQWEKIVQGWKNAYHDLYYGVEALLEKGDGSPKKLPEIPEGWMTPSNLETTTIPKKVLAVDYGKKNGEKTVALEFVKKGDIVNVTGEYVITGPERKIINAIAWLESIGVADPEQTAVAFLAGYTYGGGGFNNPRGALRTKGLVEYRPGNHITLTELGRSVAETPDVPLTNDALHRHVLDILPGPERRILEVLLSEHPNAVSNEDLANRTGYTPGSGGFNNPRGRLRTLGLVEYPQPGFVKARDILFVE